jgi:hypothetical protein
MNDFSDREMYEWAAGNAVALLVAGDAFLPERGIEPSEFYQYFGESYASGWDAYSGDLGATAREVALNMTSAGFESSIETGQPDAVVHATWTEQHDGTAWPTPVKPALERAIPVLFEAAMARVGTRMTASPSADGIDLRLAAREKD